MSEELSSIIQASVTSFCETPDVRYSLHLGTLSTHMVRVLRLVSPAFCYRREAMVERSRGHIHPWS
jgi:hypothetical protein